MATCSPIENLFSACGHSSALNIFTSCMYARQDCKYDYTDRWIGLILPANVTDCGCADPTSSACAVCRSRWTWLDGSSISTQRFTGTEPGLGERCGRITESGSWAGAPNCNRTFKAICKKGILRFSFIKTIIFNPHHFHFVTLAACMFSWKMHTYM